MRKERDLNGRTLGEPPACMVRGMWRMLRGGLRSQLTLLNGWHEGGECGDAALGDVAERAGSGSVRTKQPCVDSHKPGV